MSYGEKYAEYLRAFERALMTEVGRIEKKANPRLAQAMAYSLTAGGKRIRPVLLLAACDMLGAEEARAMPFALGAEFVHTYSLIHDDLPAMDDDDFRRGRPSLHKAFDEATAILAGDALLNYAYELVLSEARDESGVRAAAILAESAGCFGMVSGQAYDLEGTGEMRDEDALFRIQALKTGKLITAPLLMAAELAGGIYRKELSEYGDALGKLFQITDDVLDAISSRERFGKSVGKDAAQNKFTSVSLWGVDGATGKARAFCGRCADFAGSLPGGGIFLSDLAKGVLDRIFS